MTDITINLTDAEYKALEAIAESAESWAQISVQHRAQQSYNEIYRRTVDRYLEEGITIPGSKDEIVLDAFARGWEKTVVDANAEVIDQLNEKNS